MATVHQNKIVSTIRNSKIVSDPTNILALERTSRRLDLLKKDVKSNEPVRFGTSHRAVRAQPLADPKYFAHFKLFSMVTAGRALGNYDFELNHLFEHLEFYVLLTSQFPEFQYFNVKIKITDLTMGLLKERIQEKVVNPLKQKYEEVEVLFDDAPEAGRGYYQKVCFKADMENSKGWTFSLGDGGFTDWTPKIMNNKKERFLISGFGS